MLYVVSFVCWREDEGHSVSTPVAHTKPARNFGFTTNFSNLVIAFDCRNDDLVVFTKVCWRDRLAVLCCWLGGLLVVGLVPEHLKTYINNH